jgi:predicted aconitase with swiveling domain
MMVVVGRRRSEEQEYLKGEVPAACSTELVWGGLANLAWQTPALLNEHSAIHGVNLRGKILNMP